MFGLEAAIVSVCGERSFCMDFSFLVLLSTFKSFLRSRLLAVVGESLSLGLFGFSVPRSQEDVEAEGASQRLLFNIIIERCETETRETVTKRERHQDSLSVYPSVMEHVGARPA